jgi:hypothetical protein
MGAPLSDLLHVTQELQQELERGVGKWKGSSIFRFAAHKTKALAGIRNGIRKEEGEPLFHSCCT